MNEHLTTIGVLEVLDMSNLHVLNEHAFFPLLFCSHAHLNIKSLHLQLY